MLRRGNAATHSVAGRGWRSSEPKGRSAPSRDQAIMIRVDKNFVERAHTVLLLGILWGALAVCVLGALSYDIAFWFGSW
jgi:hypothetical protein